MTDEKQAVAEGILKRIWREEWHDLDLLLNRTGDVQFWADVMRYELDLGTLTKDLLQSDTTLVSLEDFHVQSMSPFHYAGMRGAATVLRRGLQVGLNLEVGLRNGTTVLHLASFAGKMETVTLLVDEFQANVNREDGNHCCPLHYASAQGHQRVVEFLVSRGADIGARDSEGATAVYHARRNRQQPIVSYLLDISGDGDVLLVEEQWLIDEVHTEAEKASPLYTRVCKKNKKRLPALDYEEVESSFDRDTRDETFKGSQDMGDTSRPTDKKKDVKKSEKRMVYENTELPFASASPIETEGGQSSASKYSSDEKRQVLKPSREDFGLICDTTANCVALSERAALDRCDESNEVTKYNLRSGRRQHCYEEIKLPDDSVTDPTVSCGLASVEESINMTKGGFRRRNHIYEEIELPSDTMPHSEMGLHNRNACTENAPVTPTVIANCFSRNDQYEELSTFSDSADLNSKSLNESATEEEIVPTIDISKFVRRPHKYEEIKLPCDEDPNKKHLDEHQVEQEVRQLLRKEMRKLELMGNAVDMDNSARGSDAIRSFFNVSKIAEDVAPDSHYDLAAVITLRQLQRVLREEFQRFADQQLRLAGPPSKLGVKNKDDLTTTPTSTSTLTPSVTGLYDELTICNIDETESEFGKIETSKPAPRKENHPGEDIDRKEKKQRDDSPTSLPQSTDKKKQEIAEQTNKELKLNFSPLLLRRDPRNRKEKGKESRSPHRSPLRLHAQNDKMREVKDPKTEQDLQKTDELSVKAGHSQFYVSLAHNNKYSEI